MHRPIHVVSTALAVCLAAACSSASDTSGESSSQSGGSGGSLPDGGSGAGMPSTFIPADQGAYALGAPVGTDMNPMTNPAGDQGCNVLIGVVRDFKAADQPGGHPDFEAYLGSTETTGLVEPTLSADSKPVFSGHCAAGSADASCPYGPMLTSSPYFDEWYRHNDGVDLPYLIYFQFVGNGGISTFASSHFFPLDGTGWGNSGSDDKGMPHNYHFTTELHTKFKYVGGEVFTFTGDDDLWVFVNGKLAIDLGGVHPAANASLDLDASAGALGITPGNVYPLELFHAERHTVASNFHVDTNLAFVDCGTIPAQPK